MTGHPGFHWWHLATLGREIRKELSRRHGSEQSPKGGNGGCIDPVRKSGRPGDLSRSPDHDGMGSVDHGFSEEHWKETSLLGPVGKKRSLVLSPVQGDIGGGFQWSV